MSYDSIMRKCYLASMRSAALQYRACLVNPFGCGLSPNANTFLKTSKTYRDMARPKVLDFETTLDFANRTDKDYGRKEYDGP